ncbi:MAG: ATP-dependent helicase HrpB [Paracoccaceae bacterium]|jgi:ATP-dependent helicase HrpB
MLLPVQSVLPSLIQAFMDRDEAILVAAPGAGKTTLVPLALLDQPWLRGQRILLLEPRRLAARMAAQRMAELLSERLGETIGYRMRLDSKESAATRILVVTEGVLTRMLQSDPSLDGYGLLIFDEFHERSLDADLGLALSLYSRALFRQEAPLKLLLMSATLDSDALSALLNDAPIIRSEGRTYPVDVHYGKNIPLRDLVAETALAVCRSLEQDTGSLLVFLPGQAEIGALARQLQNRVSEQVLLVPLYGNLSIDAQRRAIEPAAAGLRKVVMATNLAESSLTIEGVTVVVDCGYSRVPQFDPRSGMTRLHTQKVSRASADQRAGRAGRLGPGTAYRLWPESETLAAFSEPEIAQGDLASLALHLLQWGVQPQELAWLNSPRVAPYQQAMDLLLRLGACSDCGQITAHGEAMAALPVHPRLAHMLLRAHEWGAGRLACDVAAILAERDPAPESGADIKLRLNLLATGSERQPAIKRLRQQAQQYRRVLKCESNYPPEAGMAGLLLALAYPDRIARQRAPGTEDYLLANGRAACLRDDDPLRNMPWLVVANLGGRAGQAQDRIFMAAEFDPPWLESQLSDYLSIHDIAEWREDGKLLVETQYRVGRIVVKREPVNSIDEQVSKSAVLDWLAKDGLSALPWDDKLRQWQQRVLCLRSAFKGALKGELGDWPDVSDAWLQQHLGSWLLPFLPAISHRRQLQKIDLRAALHSLLPWPLPQKLDELAPSHMAVPSGSNIAIDYAQTPPVLAVKLQEMFGQKSTPTIAIGRVQLVLHLLSPARRPLQVTRDLENFWQNTYADVKRDMKGRYPRHPWPDDPLTAAPKRGTKKQGV